MNDFESRLLISLFVASRDTQNPNVARLSEALGVPHSLVSTGLLLLEARGWVDAERVRLTLAGLAVAGSLHTRSLRLMDVKFHAA